jgi:hypothetical protein
MELGLLTSGLDTCPVKRKDILILILIVNALHRTEDMPGVLEGLLGKGYKHILLVELNNNFLLWLLEGRGVSRRVRLHFHNNRQDHWSALGLGVEKSR